VGEDPIGLFSDNFDNSDDDTTSKRLNTRTDFSGISGMLDEAHYLAYFGVPHYLTNDTLELNKRNAGTAPGAGVRFGSSTNRFNWADSATTGDVILGGGGMKVSMDFKLTDVTDDNDWIGFAFGTLNADPDQAEFFLASGVDFGLRFEGDRVVSYVAGAEETAASYGTALVAGEWAELEIVLEIDDFSSGAAATATVRVNGEWCLSESLTLDSTADFRWEFGVGSAATAGSEHFADNLVVTTAGPPDYDMDGLPDAWEYAHFGSMDSGGGEDVDGDGTPAWLEHALGFDPNDPGERFKSELRESPPGEFNMVWPNSGEADFQVETSDSMSGLWQAGDSYSGAEVPAELSHPVVFDELRMFYRVRAMQRP
jgi:hypothetical protein